MTSPNQAKPVLVIDDDRSMVLYLARGARRFGGLPVEYHRSIEGFMRTKGIVDNDKEGLARVLRDYGAIVCDNNLESASNDYPGDGRKRGIDFLEDQAGPAVETLPEKDRPILVCFAPSSQGVIDNNEQRLWEKYKVVCPDFFLLVLQKRNGSLLNETFSGNFVFDLHI